METIIIIFLSAIIIFLIFLLIKSYRSNQAEKTNHQTTKRITEFLYLVTSCSSGSPKLELLAEIDIIALRGLKHQLLSYYQKIFLPKSFTATDLKKLHQYIQKLNYIPNSLQKDFLGNTLREAIFSQPVHEIAEIIYLAIKIKNTTGHEQGIEIESFLLEDAAKLNAILKEKSLLLITTMASKKALVKATNSKMIHPEDKDRIIFDLKKIVDILQKI